MIVKNSVTLICFVVFFKNGLTERYNDCLEVVCPSIENDKLKCLADSKPIIIDPSASNSPHAVLGDFIQIEDALSNHHPRFPRFVAKLRTRRESDEKSKALCCPYIKCICNECKEPVCDSKNHTAVVKLLTAREPGSCCPTYECQEKPDCKTKQNGFTWLEHCARCQCHDKEYFCHETCGDQEPKSCVQGTKMYMNGERWKQDACTECYCNEGVARCEIPLCPTLSCLKTIQHQNSCCPDCDKTNSSFCPGMENCGIACKHDYVKTNEGCFLCTCAPYKTSNVSTTTTSSSTATSSTTTTELPITIKTVDKHNADDTMKLDDHSNTVKIMIILVCGLVCAGIFVCCICKLSKKMKEKKKYDRVDQINSNSSDTSSAKIIK